MGSVDRNAAAEALAAAYGKVTAAVDGLGDAELMRPSRCAGRVVADVLYQWHLSDASSTVFSASPCRRTGTMPRSPSRAPGACP